MAGYKLVFNADYSSEDRYRTLEGMSPLQWWKARRGLKDYALLTCASVMCNKGATDGAHVIDMETGKYVYIIPLCHKHNEYEKTFLVPQDLLEECTGIENQSELIELNADKYDSLK